jgi:2-dehydro-3-deoxygluconokinase
MLNRIPRVALFGELLLRLTTPGNERIVQAKSFNANYTGGEANAGALLCTLGVEACLIAAVPENEVGQACLNEMRRFGMDTRHVLRCGPRLGALYVETGAAQRQSKVVYDRAGSSFSQLKPGDVNWRQVLEDADWLHFTGTAPALSPQLAELTIEGCQIAKSLGKTVSCDLNYRSTLWTIDEARDVFQRIAPHLDVLIANEEHARLLLDAPAATFKNPENVFEAAAYKRPTEWLRSKYGVQQVALTIRTGATSDDTTFAALVDNGQASHLSRIHHSRVIDRIGSGDAFTGALIYGALKNWELPRRVEFAAAAASIKNAILGDFCLATEDEIDAVATGQSAGRISR